MQTIKDKDVEFIVNEIHKIQLELGSMMRKLENIKEKL